MITISLLGLCHCNEEGGREMAPGTGRETKRQAEAEAVAETVAEEGAERCQSLVFSANVHCNKGTNKCHISAAVPARRQLPSSVQLLLFGRAPLQLMSPDPG